jgi:hypothetical protein
LICKEIFVERPDLELAVSVRAGEIPDDVRDELVRLKERAKDTATDFADAIKAQSKKYVVKKGALTRWITAIAGDSVGKLKVETDSLSTLLRE